MKKQLFTICLIALTISVSAETQKEIASNIKNVTIYLQGAQISREGTISIPKGKTTLLFKGLPSKIRPESIQAKASNEVMIISVTHSLDLLNKTIVTDSIN